MALPSNVGYGTIVGKFLKTALDSVDIGVEPDGIPLADLTITFTPSIGKNGVLRNVTATPPVIIVADAIVAKTNVVGELYNPETGQAAVTLVATDDPDITPTNWTYKVSIEGGGLSIKPFNIAVPQGVTTDLAVAIPVPANPGTAVEEWLEAVVAVNQARADAIVAINDAVSDAILDADAAPAEALTDDIFSVRFDDGEPFFTANEELGIFDTKFVGNEVVDIEETLGEPGWQFCYYRKDSAGKIYRLFGLKDDGTFYPTGLGVDQSGPGIAHWGDSLTAGAGGGGVTTVNTIGALSGRQTFNGGIGGERSPDIAMRQGGNPLFLDFSGTIPASTTPVTVGVYRRNGTPVTTLIKQGTAGVNPVTATLPSGARVQGTLTWDGTNYKFARLTAGPSVSVNRRIPILGAGAAYRSWIQLLQPGRNNAAELAQIQEDTVSMVDSLVPARKKFLVLGILNGIASNGEPEGPGTSSYAAIVAHTDWALTKYGRRFVDIRRYLIDYGLADAKSYGLLPSDFTPTTTDLANIAADTVPQTLRNDTLHLTGVGYTLVGRYVYERLVEMGWL